MPAAAKSVHVGFTLVELLVTLSLLGLVSALAIPNVAAWLAAREFAAAVSALEGEMTQLPLKAAVYGEIIDVDHKYEWQHTALQKLASVKIPVRVYSNGYCAGGSVVLEQSDRRRGFRILPPFCAVVPDGD